MKNEMITSVGLQKTVDLGFGKVEKITVAITCTTESYHMLIYRSDGSKVVCDETRSIDALFGTLEALYEADYRIVKA